MLSAIKKMFMPINSRTNNVDKVSGDVPDELGKEILSERDVVILNIIGKGNGDEALGKKMVNIALDEKCRVSILSINHKLPNINNCRNFSLRDDEPHDIRDLRNPIFIVTPVGILWKEDLATQLQNLCERYQFEKEKIILIDEMDVNQSADQTLPDYERILKKMGFENVIVRRLGFAPGSLGYIPIDEESINATKSRFEVELARLFDAYDVNLAPDSHYYMAYMSLEGYDFASKIFIANTLSEAMHDDKDANYIMVARQFSSWESQKKKLFNDLSSILSFKNRELNYPRLFSKAVVGFVDKKTGKIVDHQVITGEGKRKINILFTSSLPKNIFDDFMCLCETGMVSGDQSFSEYLTFKGKLPYYNIQPWSNPLAIALQNLGGKELREAVLQKLIRTTAPGYEEYTLVPNVGTKRPSAALIAKEDEYNKNLASANATPKIREFLRDNELERIKRSMRKSAAK